MPRRSNPPHRLTCGCRVVLEQGQPQGMMLLLPMVPILDMMPLNQATVSRLPATTSLPILLLRLADHPHLIACRPSI